MVSRSVLEYANGILRRIGGSGERSSTVATSGLINVKPSQADKLSPTSHFVVQDLLRRKNKEYPRSEGYCVSLVANTNSMEPLIDDNSVIVSEDFRTVKGAAFLLDAPVRPGDICVYLGDQNIWGKTSDGKPVQIIHMVEQIRTYRGSDGKMITEAKFQGYNNFMADPGWVPMDKIILRAFEFSCAKQSRIGD